MRHKRASLSPTVLPSDRALSYPPFKFITYGLQSHAADVAFTALMAVNLLIAAFCSALAAFVDALPLLWNICSNNSLCPTIIAVIASRPFGDGKFPASLGWTGLWDVLSESRTSEAISIAVQKYTPHELNLSIPPVAILSALGLCCAAALTHGLGGRLKYRHLPWMFWQPFAGGARFVFMQVSSTSFASLFSFLLRCLILQNFIRISGKFCCSRCSLVLVHTNLA